MKMFFKVLDFLIYLLTLVAEICAILTAYFDFHEGKINEAIFWIICGVFCELMQIKLKISS